MKVLFIRGENIASLAGPFEVRFDAPPLSQTGLFAISGNTGAGKTSLLDAMCLALFDNTPRLGKSRGDKQERDGISSADPRNLLTTGAAAGYAEVGFVGADNIAWRAKWSVRRARNKPDGRLQNQQIELYEAAADKLVSGGRKRDTLHRIEQCLGLNFSQFQRSVLLPQGDFAQFLKANESERAELLEQITGTEIYSRLSKRAHEKAREWSDKLDAERARLELDMPLDDEARTELERQRAESGAALAQAELALGLLKRQLAWYEEKQQLANKIESVQQERHAIKAELKALQPRREKLAAVMSVQPLRGVFDQAQMLRKSIRQLEVDEAALATQKTALDEKIAALDARTKALEKSSEAARKARLEAAPELIKARQIDEKLERLKADQKEKDREIVKQTRALAEKERQREALQEKLKTNSEEAAELNRFFDAHPALEKLAADQAKVEHLLTRHEQTRSRLEVLKSDLEALEKKQQTLDDAHHDARKRYEKLSERLAREEAGLKKLAASGQKHDLNELRAAREKWRGELERLQTLSGLLDEQDRIKQRQTALRDELKSVQAVLDEAAQGLALDQDHLAQAEAVRKEAASALQLALQASNADAESMRASLAPGQPCPVCGSKEHPWASDSPALEGLLAEQRKRVDQLEKQVARWREAITKHNVLVEQKTREKSRLEEELSQSEGALKELSKAWKGASAQKETRKTLAAGKKQAEESLADISEEEKQALTFIQKLRQAEQAAHELQEQSRNQERQLDDIALERRKLDADRKPMLAEMRQCEKDLPELRDQLSAWFDQETLVGAAAQLVSETQKNVALWTRKKERGEALEKIFAELDNKIKLVSAECEHLQTQLAKFRATRDELDHRYSEAMDARLALFGGRPVAQVSAALDKAEDEAKSALDKAVKQLHADARESARIEAQMGEKRVAAQKQQEALSDLEKQLQTRADSLGLAISAVADLLASDEQWLKKEQAQIEKVESREKTAAVRLREWRDQLRYHTGNDMPEKKEGALRKAADRQQKEVSRLRDVVAEQDVLIRQDDARRKKLEKQNQAMLALQEQAGVWQKMKSVIGSADGSRFRNFAQSVTLDSLIAYANAHLRDLARRYRIERVEGSDLGIQIVDTEMGDEKRSVYSLSGGESFLVSLALALGLASLSAARTPVETLFIDEGFGSLDARTLDTALAALDTLQAQGRKIGVISHVNALVERIGVVVRVSTASAGRSRIEVVG